MNERISNYEYLAQGAVPEAKIRIFEWKPNELMWHQQELQFQNQKRKKLMSDCRNTF